MEIVLKKYSGEVVDGEETFEEKIYIAPSSRARMVRKAIEMTETMSFDNLKTSDLDGLVNYLVDLFRGQFTIDDVYDGIDSDKLLPTLFDCINGVVGTMGAKIEQLPKNE